MFAKYARAVGDDHERSRLHKTYVARNVWCVLTLIFLIAIYAIALAAPPEESAADELTPLQVALLLSLLGMLISFIVAIVMQVRFSLRFKRLVADGTPGESAEVASYRAKYRTESRVELKAAALPLAAAIVLIVAGLVLFIYSSFNYVEDEFSPLSVIGTILIIFGIMLLFFYFAIRQTKRSAKGETFEQRAADEAASIDAAQGRQHKYRLEEDRNAQNLTYLYPTPTLRERQEQNRKKYYRRLFGWLIVGMALSIIGIFVFFTDLLFSGSEFVGYAFPFMIFVTCACVFGGVLPQVRRVSAVEKKQYTELQTNPDYALNLRLYELYKKYNKTWGLLPLYGLAASFVVALALAIALPATFFSMFGLLPLFAALFGNVHNVKKLRLQAKPLEDEIDARAATVNEDPPPTENEDRENIDSNN